MTGEVSGGAVRIGCASGFWGDSRIGIEQMLTVDGLRYVVFDYLAETTMSVLQRARMREPELGYATDFVTAVIEPHLRTVLERGVRLVANAGGLNPDGCRDAILAVARAQGLEPRVAVVSGDDVLHLAGRFAADADGVRGAAVPGPLLSANAYLGASPIVDALRTGADVVITGRGVDSAPMLGIAAFEHGWAFDDHDRLAQASLAGHLVECGAQATGGLFTDWETVPDWANIGYPFVDLEPDGGFTLGKPAGTGGLVTPATVSEQLLYEIGDPAAYVLPDVICDFRDVRIVACGEDRVRVTGARGRAPSGRYKVTTTREDGFQTVVMMAIRGRAAPEKARRTADELLRRTRAMLERAGLGDYRDTRIELLGAEAMWGPHAQACASREIVLRIAAQHRNRKGLEFLQKESTSAGTSMGPGTRSHFGGRADIQAVIRTDAFFVDKALVRIRVSADGLECLPDAPAARASAAAPGAGCTPVEPRARFRDDAGRRGSGEAEAPSHASEVPDGAPCVTVPLSRLAYARSGDKGDDSNVGVIARRPELLPVLRERLTREAVKAWFAHLATGDVERYELPGIHALNFVLRDSLGGGGSASLRSDPLGKCYAQLLLDMPVACPAVLLGS